MIENYLNEFFNSPNSISEEKISYIKNYFYPQINQFKNIKRENFEVGINNNKNILFFRDKNYKHEEVVLHLITNKIFNHFRKNLLLTYNSSNSFNRKNNEVKFFSIDNETDYETEYDSENESTSDINITKNQCFITKCICNKNKKPRYNKYKNNKNNKNNKNTCILF